jgi:hypothetical protein
MKYRLMVDLTNEPSIPSPLAGEVAVEFEARDDEEAREIATESQAELTYKWRLQRRFQDPIGHAWEDVSL